MLGEVTLGLGTLFINSSGIVFVIELMRWIARSVMSWVLPCPSHVCRADYATPRGSFCKQKTQPRAATSSGYCWLAGASIFCS